MQHIFLERFVKFAYRSDTILKICNPKLYARYQRVMNRLHSFTENIIQERRKDMLNNPPTDFETRESQDSEGICIILYFYSNTLLN